MNREQKIAWFLIINFSIAIGLSLIAFGILYSIFGLPVAAAGFGFLGICGLTPLLFKKGEGAVCDERDVMIGRKASLAGFVAAYLFVGLACMLPFCLQLPSFLQGHNATISVSWLPMIFMGACACSVYSRSIVLLVLYGRGGQSNE